MNQKPEDSIEHHSDPMDANDDDFEIQVEPDHDDESFMPPQDDDIQEQVSEYPTQAVSKNEEGSSSNSREDYNSAAKGNFDSNSMGTQNMDFNNPVMQQMQQMMSNGFNPMMSM